MSSNSSLAMLDERANVPAPVVETSSSAVAARERAAVEARFVVAINRPRNPDQARSRLLVRCRMPRFAEVAEYAKPIGGKKVRGASIRMMEEVARQFGNIDVQSPVIFDDVERRIVRVTATDLETNYSQSTDVILEKTVERKHPKDGDEILGSRTNSQNERVYRIRADEDAFLVKQNANVSKARREMIRAVVPGDLVEEAMAVCSETRRNEVKTDPTAARKRLADAFFALGVMPAQLCQLLNKPSLEAVTEAEIEFLRAIYTSMKEGEATWADVMEEQRGKATESNGAAAPAKGNDALKAALGKKGKKGGPSEVSEAEPTSSTAQAATATASGGGDATDDDILAQDRELFERENR